MASDRLACFEFLLTPSLLEMHLAQPDPIPTPLELLTQFIFHEIIKKNSASNNEEDDPEVREIQLKKQHVLTVLPLQIGAHFNWKLEVFETNLPHHILNRLLLHLLYETLDDLGPSASCGVLDTGPLKPHQQFSIALYHRYALRALVNNKLPSKPHKIPNVIIPGQQDPMVESREVQENIIAGLERNIENSIRTLEQLLGAGEIRAPTLSSFATGITGKADSSSHQWQLCQIVPDEQFKCQIHYDLGVYHFTMERYGEAFHHFTEAIQIYPELGNSPDYCNVDEKKLKGYHMSCASVCGRQTPVNKRSLYDQFNHSISNNFINIIEILQEDNMVAKIPFYLRQNLYLDMLSFPDKLPTGRMLMFQIHTLNTIRCVLHGEVWDSSYVLELSKAGKQGAQYLIETLSSKIRKYSAMQKDYVRTLIITLNINEGISDILVPCLMSHDAAFANLFSHQEFCDMLAKPDDKAVKLTKSAYNVSLGADYKDYGDLCWDIIHSYDPALLKMAILHYNTNTPTDQQSSNKDVSELNVNWELAIPVHNTLMKLSSTVLRNTLFIFIAKSDEAASSKNYKCALDLLSEACEILKGSNSRESSRLFKMITWLILITKIQQCLDQLPCVEEGLMVSLTSEAKQCLSSLSGREGVVPWSKVVKWCVLLLLNVQDWPTLLSGIPFQPQHMQLLSLVKPLSAVALSLEEKKTSKEPWYELWDSVLSIVLGGNSSGSRRNVPNISDRNSDAGSRIAFLELVGNLKEANCLSILISLLSHCLNKLNDEPSCDLHIDHLAMWPSSIDMEMKDNVKSSKETLKDTLQVLVDHATTLYPAASHTSVSLCTSWHLTKADLAFLNEEHQKAIQGYLTAIFVATDYLRNDIPDHVISSDLITTRMIRCCMNLKCYTQAAILCQFLEVIDYNTALRCLQERHSVDAMDAYYNCLWDVTLMEFIINMHQKRGEIHRRDKVLKIIGLLEVNSNNNEEIQREAAKSRKHRFLRALAKQYL